MGRDREGDEASKPEVEASAPNASNASDVIFTPARGLTRKNALALQRSAGNRAMIRLLRAVAPPAGGRRLARTPASPSRFSIVAAGALAGTGQVPQDDFLDAVEAAVHEVVDRELAGTIFRSQGCPWIAHWIAYYRERTPTEVQAALEQYAPATAEADSLDEVLAAITDRVREGVASWRTGGDAPEVAAPASGGPPPSDGKRLLMRTPLDAGDARGALAELGPGRPLEPSVATRMGPLLGADLSHARVHTDALGGQVAERHRATAVAVGSHVAFARGTYEPGTPLGDALIAHELAHVAQYDETPGARVATTFEAEREADAAGIAAYLRQGAGHTLRAAAGSLRRSVRSGLALRKCDPKQWPTTPGVYGVAPEMVRPGFDRDGNIAGEIPKVVKNSDTSSFSFDADGDQTKELAAEIKVNEVYASGAAKKLNVALTQLSSKTRLSADFELGDIAKGGGLPNVGVAEVTDGDRPTKVILTQPAGTQELHIKPAERTATTVRHWVELVVRDAGPISPARVVRRVNYDFPAETAQINEVFATYDPSKDPEHQGPRDFVRVGHLWTLDVTIGAYGDRFRTTFRRVREGATTVEMGFAALARGKGAAEDAENQPLAGRTIVLETSTGTGALAPKIIKTDPTQLALDIDGDGRADVRLHDRLTLRADAKDGGKKDRDHEITISGPGVRNPLRLDYPVRDGYILAGPPKGAAADFAGASATHAASSLQAQEQVGIFEDAKGHILGELVATERTLGGLRRQAKEEGLLSEALYKAWTDAEFDFAAIEAWQDASPPQELVASVEKTALAFFDQLESDSWRGHEDIEGADNATVAQKNPFTGTQKQLIWLGGSNDVRGPFAAKLKARNWKEAHKTYRELVDGLDRWVAYLNREKYGKTVDLEKPETQRAVVGERLSAIRQALRDLEPKKPTRVAAVLHTDEYFEHMGDVQEIPLSLYYWKEDGDWNIKDLTTPGDMPEWDVKAKDGESEPPKRLFDDLDDNDHFPKGYIHWMLPSGTGGRVRTTGPSTIKRWATYIGLAAAAIGLGLATFGTGTVAVAGAYILAGSAVIGAGTAIHDLYDKGTHGTLEAGTAILDVAQIASAVTGLGALRFGRILANVRTAAAAGTAVEASAIKLAQQAYVPLRLGQVASDVVTLAVMSAELEKHVKRIREAPISKDERNRALALLFTQFAFTGGLTALSVKGLMPEMVGHGQDIAIVRFGDKEFAIPKGQSLQGKAINESAIKLGDAPDVAAQQQHLTTIGKIGGKPGQALSQIESMRMSPDAAGNLSVDAAGKMAANGKASGDLSDLIEQAQLANAAGAAHGVGWQYRIQIGKAGTDGTSTVKIIAEPRGGPAPSGDIASLQLFTNTTSGRAQLIADKAQQLKKLDVESRVEILADGRLRINNQVEIGPEMLSKLKEGELRTLLKGTKKLDDTGWSYETLKEKDRALWDELEQKLLSTGAYRLRVAAQKTGGLKFGQERLDLPPDLRTELGVLMGSADEASLTRFFDLANESSGFKEVLDRQARSLAARIALEGKPKNLVDFVNRYQYARAELIRQKAIAGKGVAKERPVLERYENDKALRDAVIAAENAGRASNAARVGTTSITPGSTKEETVQALRDKGDALKFHDEGALTYHTRKHHNEIPEDVRAGRPGMKGTEVEAYLDEAMKTLKNPAQHPDAVKSMPTQDGLGTVYTFERLRPGQPAGGRTSKLLVLVRFDGQTSILTYIP